MASLVKALIISAINAVIIVSINITVSFVGHAAGLFAFSTDSIWSVRTAIIFAIAFTANFSYMLHYFKKEEGQAG